MKKGTYLVALVALMAVTVFTACEKNEVNKAHDEFEYENIKNIYNNTISEFGNLYKTTSARSSSITDSEQYLTAQDYSPIFESKKDFIAFLNTKNYSATTNKILSQLPDVFSGKIVLPMIEEVISYEIPIYEKELLAQTLGLIEGIKANVFMPETRLTYDEAMSRCFDDYMGDLGMAVVEGVGAVGGPVGAGVACAVVGTIAVVKAQISFNRCKRNAKDLK